MTKKTTKRALISSLLMLAICFTTLVGTTFAWFTDSASSTGNTIKTGKLDIELYTYDANNNLVDITNNTEGDDPVFGADILWEPNATQVRYFQVKNAGNLALKFNVALEVYGVTKNLHEVMQYAVIPGADPVNNPVNSWNGGTDIVVGKNPTSYADIKLEENGDVANFAIAVHMDHNAGNQYQMAQILFDINVLAGQLSFEEDSFGSDYDYYAAYPGFGSANMNGSSAVVINITGEDGAKVGSAVIPADATNTSDVSVRIEKLVESYGNITATAGNVVQSFDVEVIGLKENNDVPVRIALRIPTGIDPSTVRLFHYNTELEYETDFIYNTNTGYVTFESATFSPFTVIYADDYSYVAPEVEESIYPVANVTYMPKYVGDENLPWKEFGGYYPTEGLDSVLEAAFLFTCPDLKPEVYEAYANWYCDFYVSLDRDLPADSIFLGGNYGEFGWVGFHNGNITLKANEELPLMQSALGANNPLIYADIEMFVKEFLCGVGDVDDALAGATFTVKLCLTNPNTDERIAVNTVSYTFGRTAEDGTVYEAHLVIDGKVIY